jgi:hypothetical protein
MTEEEPGGTLEAIVAAFKYGYVLGHRATIAGKYNGTKK